MGRSGALDSFTYGWSTLGLGGLTSSARLAGTDVVDFHVLLGNMVVC